MTKSQIEELFACISTVLALLFYQNDFIILSYLFAIKGGFEFITAIKISNKEVKEELKNDKNSSDNSQNGQVPQDTRSRTDVGSYN